SACIAPYPRFRGAAAWGPLYSVSSSSSNGSLNCSGSLYGPSSHSGLGGSRLGGLDTSRSVGQPLTDNAPDRPLSAFCIVNAERGAVVVSEIELCEVAEQVRLAHMEVTTIN